MQFEVCTLTAIRKQYKMARKNRAISTITNQLRREPASLTLRAKLGRLITQRKIDIFHFIVQPTPNITQQLYGSIAVVLC
jgi:hypothetical protein